MVSGDGVMMSPMTWANLLRKFPIMEIILRLARRGGVVRSGRVYRKGLEESMAVWVSRAHKKDGTGRNVHKWWIDCDKHGPVSKTGQTTKEYAVERALLHGECGEIWVVEKVSTGKYKARGVRGETELGGKSANYLKEFINGTPSTV